MPQALNYILSFSLLILFSFSGFSNDNDDWKNKVSNQILTKLENTDNVNILVYFKDQLRFSNQIGGNKKIKGRMVFETLQAQSGNSQGKVIEFLHREDIPFRSFYIVNAISLQTDADHIKRIAEFDEVLSIAFDSPINNSLDRLEAEQSSYREGVPEWGLQIIQAPEVWEMGYKGEGVIIGGQDTGYDWTHPALQKRYRGYINENEADHNYNWHDSVHEISPLHNDSIVDPSNNPCGLDVPYPCDDHNHGTHTMGTMLGLDGDNVIGVAPDAQWIGVRNMERGWGSPATYLESFEWFLAPTDLNNQNPDPDKAPHVINNSWSCPLVEGCDSTNWQFMDIAVNNLRAAGVVVVVSAGNNGNACGRVNAPPAMLEPSFSVAATRLVDTIDGQFIDDIAGYSSWGPVTVDNSNRLKPDIAAPGSQVRSSIPGNKYSTSSGTSMAGPHVAGLVALIISAAPDLAGKVNEIQEIIELSAEPKIREALCGEFSAEDVPNFVFGHGRINAFNAVNIALMYNSTEEIKAIAPELRIYPNPVRDFITINWDSSQLDSNIKITDLQGRAKVFGSLHNGGKIDLSSLPDGFYVVKAVIDHHIISKKILKQSSN